MKSILTIAFACFCFSLVSCKKDYTCNCTDTSVTPNETDSFPFKNTTKASAKTACDLLKTNSGGIYSSCELK